jgi:hypothetical protein
MYIATCCNTKAVASPHIASFPAGFALTKYTVCYILRDLVDGIQYTPSTMTVVFTPQFCTQSAGMLGMQVHRSTQTGAPVVDGPAAQRCTMPFSSRCCMRMDYLETRVLRFQSSSPSFSPSGSVIVSVVMVPLLIARWDPARPGR